jgi:hypothetical protein
MAIKHRLKVLWWVLTKPSEVDLAIILTHQIVDGRFNIEVDLDTVYRRYELVSVDRQPD